MGLGRRHLAVAFTVVFTIAVTVAFTIVAPVATALADPPRQPTSVADLRAGLTTQLAEEAATIERASGTVRDKLAAADAVRVRRLVAAYRLLHSPAARSRGTPAPDPFAAARRRAAARLLIERDLAERRMLADELGQLRDAATHIASEATRVAAVVLPAALARPARGTIVRRFGAFQHDPSQATLSRRGVDLEVEPRAEVVASAAGTVRYAGPIRGLESGVIIDHGTYFTVVAKLAELAVPVGAPVARGDRLGHAARARVYLEVRVKLGAGGLPIDPEPVLEPQAPLAPQRSRDPR